MKIVAIIPARYGSTRIPCKPLVEINGKTILEHVYSTCQKMEELDEILVATDHFEIYNFCKKKNLNVLMTNKLHKSAANRLYEVATKIQADYYLQINADEPLIEITDLKNMICNEFVCEEKLKNSAYGINLIAPIYTRDELEDPSNIKVVFDNSMNIIYMSRTIIPYNYNDNDNDNKHTYYKHIGVIGYSKKMLDLYDKETPGTLELIENIDTLRFIDYGKKLKCVRTNSHLLSVDTIDDIKKVQILLEKRQWK